MQVKGEIQLDTAINSPTKRSLEPNNFSSLQKDYICSNSFVSQQPSKMSQTQSYIYNHQLIRQVMKSSRNKSVYHDVNRIDQRKPLYAQPIKFLQNQFKFDSIPSRNLMYASECSAKIKKIKEELAETHDASLKEIQDKKSEVRESYKKRPTSASGRINTKNPKVNVTGLISYSFNSVNARKSLGFNKLNRQQNLIREIEQKEQIRFCCSQRQGKILEKSSARRFLKHSKNQNAIMSDFICDSDSYLRMVKREKDENTLIYNECAKKMNLIKEYMEQQKTNYDDAAYIVNEIQSRQKVQKIKQKPVPTKGELNDERGLNNRRMPVQYKPLLVKNFTFIQ